MLLKLIIRAIFWAHATFLKKNIKVDTMTNIWVPIYSMPSGPLGTLSVFILMQLISKY